MGYAPYSRITTPPDPATSGTAFTIQQDTGPRFPDPPFVALVWHDQVLPDRGVDAEELTVLSIDMDDFTCERGAEPIAITEDLQIAVLFSQSKYDLGETAVISSESFPITDTGIELHVRDSQGSVSAYTLDELAQSVGSDGGSVYTKSYETQHSGQHFYRFDSDQRAQPEQDFFVRFSEVF